MHFQTGKFITGKFICSYGTGYFQTSNFIWNWVLSNRENHLRFGTSKKGTSNVHMKLRTSKKGMKFSPSNQGISNVHMKLRTSKQVNSYEIWHFQTEKFIWILAVWNETLHVQARNFIWNLALPNMEIHMKFSASNQGNSNVHMKSGTSK